MKLISNLFRLFISLLYIFFYLIAMTAQQLKKLTVHIFNFYFKVESDNSTKKFENSYFYRCY